MFFQGNVAPATAALLLKLELAGWRISVFHLPESLLGRIGKTTEMHATRDEVQHVRHVDGWGMAEDYQCALLLASACGVDPD